MDDDERTRDMKTDRRNTRLRKLLPHAHAAAAAALLLAASAPAGVSAQADSDARWLAWMGCWEAVGGTGGTGDAMVCVLPLEGDVGVEMVSVEGGQVVAREVVRADGAMQQSDREGCRGWERARFSADGRRIYLDADHLCEGVIQQEMSGLLTLVSASEWIDVRSLSVEGQNVTGVVRYRLAPIDVAEAAGFGAVAADRAMAVRAARISAASAPAVEEVIEVSRTVDAEVARIWIAERGAPLRLNAARLRQLDEAGVPGDVIDVLVAVSFPRYFSVDDAARVSEAELRRAEEDRGPAPRGRAPVGRGGYWGPGYYGTGYYGSGFYGGYGYPGYWRPTVIVVQPQDPRTQGRVVSGRGYTQGSAPSTGSGGGSGAAAAPAPAPAPAPSGTQAAPSGRTAQPRTPPEPGG